MGSKNLKAIAVRGTGSVRVARPEGFLREMSKARSIVQAHPVTGSGLAAYGTEILVNIINEVGGLPLHNARDGSVFDRADETSGEKLSDTYLVKNQGCFGCSIACGRVTRIPRVPVRGLRRGPGVRGGLELRRRLRVDDLAAIVKSNWLCNEYGMDPITLGSTIACACELYEMGAIPESDVGSPSASAIPRPWCALVEMTAKDEGFGKMIALGSYRMAEHYGHPSFR